MRMLERSYEESQRFVLAELDKYNARQPLPGG